MTKHILTKKQGSNPIHNATAIVYTNPTYDTVAEALDALLYVSPQVLLYGGSVNEKGVTVTEVALTWANNKTVTSQSINQSIGAIAPSVFAYTHSGQTITTDRTYTITVGDGTNTDSDSTSVLFQNKRYWGVSALTSLSDAQIIALSSEFETDRLQTRTFDCTGGKYFYFAYPASFGVASFKVGGLSFSDMSLTVRAFVNASGYSESYNIYKVNNIQNGSNIEVEIL
jgi:hypothetical protein